MDRKIIEFINDNDVKFVKFGFCDPLGYQKNISVIADLLEQSFKEGIPFDSSAISCFSDVTDSDLLLFPDEKTMSLLPWRPNINSVLRFFCDVKNPDKTEFESDGRSMLKKAVAYLDKLGFSCKFGTECEFYLFKTDEHDEPTLRPLDNGGYLDIAPLDKGENIRRNICLCLEEMGLDPENSHHERGRGQNEIDFKSSSVLDSADNLLTFKSAVKSIAEQNGLFGSFMPKPFLNDCGNGLHINISLFKNGKNVFSDHEDEDFKYAKNFIAGILDKIQEITLFLNPNNNSYERFGKFEAPKYVSWSHQNRSQLIRIPLAVKGDERLELRSPDATVNPYIAFSLILYAGIYGIENDLQLQAPTEDNSGENLKILPRDLSEACDNAENSEFLQKYLGKEFLKKYIEIKRDEFDDYFNAGEKTKYYKDTYFQNL